jgi:hypothetical protein
MPPKKQSVVDLPVVGIIDLNDEAPMKQKKTKKVKEVMEAVVEMPVMEAVVEKVKKSRKVKSPVPEELELNRNYETDTEFQKNVALDFDKLLSLDFKPVKETKPKAGKNPWIEHIKAFALENGISYNKAMLHENLKKDYVKTTKGKVTLG